ncbi:sugar ABC transporter permease [Bifidobacterium imperatoris]|uniref:ABC transporter permease n=1 Tax=Bifidobacterium imperatoris TaxID=2020965 RepID=A0A2N5ITS0_9BIFI|nr:sugar ABC transporter permease [Bifidobacterium imperatoris]PLS25348.1 ABC transporter permease [Bifidobacterium imperatoris]QSY58493.1 sugar ABC transporter permease [Bifidobacterium imperatoris]
MMSKQSVQAVHGARRKNSVTPYLFVAPFVISFAVFLLIPLVEAVYKSLFTAKYEGLGFGGPHPSFVGFSNYAAILQDSDFMYGFVRVFLFGIVQVPLMMFLSLVFALLIDSSLVRFKKLDQIIIFLPYAVPTVVAAMLWGFMYQPGVSPIVKGLQQMGIPVDFLAPESVLWSAANITTWCWVGVNMVIIYSGLQAIPNEIYEAARIDGANELRIAWSIKIPMVLPSIALTLFTSIIGTVQLFNEPTILATITSNVPDSFTPMMDVVNTTVTQNNQYKGAAMSIVVAVVAFVLSALVSLMDRKKEVL